MELFNNKLLRADSLNNSLFEDLISETLKGSIDFLDVSEIKEKEYKVSSDFIRDRNFQKIYSFSLKRLQRNPVIKSD